MRVRMTNRTSRENEDLAQFRDLVATHGITVSEPVMSTLQRYRDLLLSWNDRVRLVSRSDGHRILSRHVLESLLLLQHIPRETKRLADVGSGGGLPGIPIWMASDIEVTLIESARMKSLFLKEVERTVPRGGLEILHDRAENVANSRPGTFDIVTSRAVAGLDHVWELAKPLLKHQGSMISLKGPGEAEDELGGIGVPFTEHLVPLEDRTVAIVIARRES